MGGAMMVTGGLGFIGSAFIRQLASEGVDVLNVDLGTYAGDPRRVEGVGPGRVRLVRIDVAGPELTELVARERPGTIVHLAAESHVTRSERDADRFFQTNVEGTRRVLEAADRAGTNLVVHISTDEVYGPCEGDPFREDDKPAGEGRATSAYARSKAVADDVARSFAGRVPVIVLRPTNCFGPWQHPEKAIARWISRAVLGEAIPVWGDGRYMRDWMFVDDLCAAIDAVLRRGVPGEVYNVAPSGPERTNLEVARAIADAAGVGQDQVYLTEYDRPSHDRRYAIDASKLAALAWGPTRPFEERIADTVAWYAANRDWWAGRLPEAERLYSDVSRRGSR
jgi:dTDP-glucose 4,6-dehydratase